MNIIFDIRSIIGKTADEKTDVFIDCLDKFYYSAMGKTWKDLVRDIQKEPVLKTLLGELMLHQMSICRNTIVQTMNLSLRNCPR